MRIVPAWKICITVDHLLHHGSPSVVVHLRLEELKNNAVPTRTTIRLKQLITHTLIPFHRLYRQCNLRRVPSMSHRHLRQLLGTILWKSENVSVSV
jgi:hypothetical protein